MAEILTIGYGGKKPDVFFAELKELNVDWVVDVRRDPYHAFLGVYTKSYLEKKLKNYVWIKELGNKLKTLPPELINETIGMAMLEMVCRGSKRVVLLCAEKDEKRCHRLYVKKKFMELQKQNSK